jgi:stage II sporulation protein P
MDMEGKILRLGAAVIIAATLFRLLGGMLEPENRQQLFARLLLWQTGYRLEAVQTAAPPIPPASPQETTPLPVISQQPLLPLQLTKGDLDRVQVQNGTPYSLNMEQLLEKPLQWNLQGDSPTVLILHTHATESYTQTEVYEESAAYRTLDDRFNMISLGKELARSLEAEGIMTIHDKTSYDYPSYSGAYNRAREAVKTHLEENPSICLILDLHRDALEGEDGKQLGYTQQTPEGTAAKMMIVCGSDAGGLSYPNWQENLSLGLRFQGVLERNCPGLCRPLSFRTGRYNQDLMGNMLLVEVGAAGNTRQEALLAVRELARAIADMSRGVEIEGQ